MKPIQLPKETIEALLNGASKFIMPINENTISKLKEYPNLLDDYKFRLQHGEKHFIKDYSPLKIGDEFYVKKECNDCNYQKGAYCDALCDDADIDSGCELHTNTPRGKVANIEVKRVQDIIIDTIKSLGITQDMAFEYNNWRPSYNDPDSGGRADYETAFYYWYNYQFNNYDENPYVFIVSIDSK